jgi:two-component system, NtrC family, response regulator AtoC
MARLLLVEDERLLRWALSTRLARAGHTVDEAPTLTDAAEHLGRQRYDVALLDIGLPDGNGIEFLAAQRDKLTDSIVVVMTADGTIEDAVRAMKLGANDFLAKPVDHEELLRLVDRALTLRRDGLEVESSRRAREQQTKLNLVAESAAMKEVLRLATTVASAGNTTVLIHGETGSGKEVIARFIHAQSPRANGPLQALNCAALPEHLVESELFGYEKGAFTDAKGSRKGLFELADGGTLILDEIGEIPIALQSKLLRALEERTIRRLGGVRETSVDVRVLALTNRSLKEEVAAGRFREDLYYRLNVFPIVVPPLRTRREDVVALATYFMTKFGPSCGKKFRSLSPEFQERLANYRWTGNVRELRNLIERAVILEGGDILTGTSVTFGAEETAAALTADSGKQEPIMPLEAMELMMVQRALRAANGNQSQAARLLQVTRDQLRYRVKRYREEGRLAADLTYDGNDAN